MVPGELVGTSPTELARWYVIALVPLLVGGWIGGSIARRIDPVRYRGAVHSLLLATGIGLIVAALWQG